MTPESLLIYNSSTNLIKDILIYSLSPAHTFMVHFDIPTDASKQALLKPVGIFF